MELKDMKVGDILDMPEFEKAARAEMQHVERYLKSNDETRRLTRALNRIKERGAWTPEAIKQIYHRIIHKEARGFSAIEREIISTVGFNAGRKVMLQIQMRENEKAKDKKDNG